MVDAKKGILSRWIRSSLLVVGCLIGGISAAYATGSSSGQVSFILVVASGAGAPGNYDFRVSLVGGQVICNGQTWAYVNANDANYNGISANILSSRALGIPVTLYWNQDSSGSCQIAYIKC